MAIKKMKGPQIPKRRVKLEAFAIHGHLGAEPVNYENLFRTVSGMDPTARKDKVGDRVSALPVFRQEDSRYFFAAHVGYEDASYLLLDLAAATEEERPIERGKIVARKTLGMIDPAKRLAVVQFVPQGARAGQIAQLIEKLAQRARPDQFANVSLEFTPVPAEEFLAALNQFETIKSAKVRFARPNYDWEEYGETFQTLGQDSGANGLEVAASAPRNGGLNKQGGLLGILRNVVRQKRTMIKGATVVGLLENSAGLTTLHLEKHIETRQAQVPVTGSGQPVEGEVHDLAARFLDERPSIEG